MAEEERVAMVGSCKYVDQVISGVPYIMGDHYIQSLVEEYSIDYVIHGDDPCIVNGKDIYSASKEKGLFRTIPRTEGVSTTNLLSRLLSNLAENKTTSTGNKPDKIKRRLSTGEDHSLVTKRMLHIFQAGAKEPAPGMKVVYVDGAFDMIHRGHIATLKAAKEVCYCSKRRFQGEKLSSASDSVIFLPCTVRRIAWRLPDCWGP